MIKGLVSIIVPVYNVESYLNNCLNSLLAQTYAKIEIILIDDGSVDNSSKICDEYAKKDNRIKVIHQENRGVSRARNLGLNIATGEFFSFVDGDDTVEKNYIELMVRELVDNDVDLVRLSWERGGKNCTYSINFDKNGLALVTYDNVSDLQWFANIWGLFRFDSLKNTFDEKLKYAEDNFFVFEYFLLSKRKKMLLINKPYYHYTIVNQSASQIDVVKRLSQSNLFIQYLRKKYPSDKMIENVCNKYIYKDYLVAMYYFIDSKKKEEGEFSLTLVKEKIKELRKKGAREYTRESAIVSFLYRNHLHFIMNLFRFCKNKFGKRI